jgi:hypothetical protein
LLTCKIIKETKTFPKLCIKWRYAHNDQKKFFFAILSSRFVNLLNDLLSKWHCRIDPKQKLQAICLYKYWFKQYVLVNIDLNPMGELVRVKSSLHNNPFQCFAFSRVKNQKPSMSHFLGAGFHPPILRRYDAIIR